MIRRAIACALLLLAGCSVSHPATSRSTAAPRQELSNTDPCAMRLHDICGPLLLYDSDYLRLPARLSDLHRLPGYSGLELTCPVSHLPYVYVPDGVAVAGQSGRVIVYDAAPVHAGHRWAIAMLPPNRDGALWMKVVALPVGWTPPPASTQPAH